MIVFLIIAGLMSLIIAILKACCFGAAHVDERQFFRVVDEAKGIIKEIEKLEPYISTAEITEKGLKSLCEDQILLFNDEIEELIAFGHDQNTSEEIKALYKKRNVYFDVLSKANQLSKNYTNALECYKNSRFHFIYNGLRIENLDNIQYSHIRIEPTQLTGFWSMAKFLIIAMSIFYAVTSLIHSEVNFFVLYAAVASFSCMFSFIATCLIMERKNRKNWTSPTRDVKALRRHLDYHYDLMKTEKAEVVKRNYDKLIEQADETINSFMSFVRDLSYYQDKINILDILDNVSWLSFILLIVVANFN